MGMSENNWRHVTDTVQKSRPKNQILLVLVFLLVGFFILAIIGQKDTVEKTGDVLRAKQEAIACLQQEDLERLITVSLRDIQGGKELLTKYRLSGECKLLKAGVRLRVEKYGGGLLTGANCYAEYGTADPCWWTQREAVGRVKE